MVEVESVFGQVKGNREFRRFLLRGLPKVNIEVVLLSLAHNLLKKAAVGAKGAPNSADRLILPLFQAKFSST
ncbi:transposase [Paenibacillus sp. GD4]|nr:transposase [Paenibacillus sp. GD4]MDQ1909310.1 transposase [Paenibacillus sp. GD4]